jgi:PNKP adenylyltransferase domain, ligase domain
VADLLATHDVARRDNRKARTSGTCGEGIGICYTRTGRRFFDDRKIEKEFLEKVGEPWTLQDSDSSLRPIGFVSTRKLTPWSAKAQELLRQQYAAVGAAAKASLTETVASLEQRQSSFSLGITSVYVAELPNTAADSNYFTWHGRSLFARSKSRNCFEIISQNRRLLCTPNS